TVATQIKSQMFSDPQLNGANLEVTSKEGQVTLAGTVPNDAARYKAYKIANETTGVTKVNDQITVSPPPTLERTLPPNNADPKPPFAKNALVSRPPNRARKARPKGLAESSSSDQIAADAPSTQQGQGAELAPPPDAQPQPALASPQPLLPPTPPPPPQPRQ